MQLSRDRQSNLSDIYTTQIQYDAINGCSNFNLGNARRFGSARNLGGTVFPRVTASDARTLAGQALNLVHVASASGRAAIIDRIKDHERNKADSACLILRKSRF